MNKSIVIYILACVFLFGCSGKKAYGEDATISINRFDKAIYAYIKGEKTEEALLQEYRHFLDVYGEQVVGIGNTDSSGFFLRLKNFFSHPSLMEIYDAEQIAFADLSDIEKNISSGFSFLQLSFDSIQVPEIFIHVSGLNQNVIVTDRFLSISGDKYLGSNYKWYADFFYDYQRQNMSVERVVPDYFLGFLTANMPFQGNEDVLLDKMIYEGKIRYILSMTLPSLSEAEIVGYTDKQDSWCRENEAGIWKHIIQEKQLFTPDRLVTGKYINDAPYTAFLSDQSPGRVGVWVGYRIIQSYMKQHPKTSLQSLMQQTDSQVILQASAYKP